MVRKKGRKALGPEKQDSGGRGLFTTKKLQKGDPYRRSPLCITLNLYAFRGHFNLDSLLEFLKIKDIK